MAYKIERVAGIVPINTQPYRFRPSMRKPYYCARCAVAISKDTYEENNGLCNRCVTWTRDNEEIVI